MPLVRLDLGNTFKTQTVPSPQQSSPPQASRILSSIYCVIYPSSLSCARLEGTFSRVCCIHSGVRGYQSRLNSSYSGYLEGHLQRIHTLEVFHRARFHRRSQDKSLPFLVCYGWSGFTAYITRTWFQPTFSIRNADARRGYSERAPPICSKMIYLDTFPNLFSEILPIFSPIRNISNPSSDLYPSSSVPSLDILPNPPPVCFRALLRFTSELSSDFFRARRRVELHLYTARNQTTNIFLSFFPVDERHPRPTKASPTESIIALESFETLSHEPSKTPSL